MDQREQQKARSVGRQAQRPLAPHLQVYRPTLTMTMSIAHRLTGVALYIGTLLLVWWLVSIASGPSAYAFEQRVMASAAGRVFLFFFTWAALHHALGGVRHLILDNGWAHDYPWREYLARTSIIASLAGVALIWIILPWLR
jgi:succinate dehydrogenase / fumarate reductase, cytochrome b subunit